MSDLLLISAGVVGFMPLFYFMTNIKLDIYSLTIYILILAPTLAALINGAPFVPTPMKAVEKMLRIARLKKGEKVYDIGCGDGRIVYLAAKKFGADATGFELSPFVYLLARVRHFFWKSGAKVKFANFKTRDLSDADVIFCYLLPETLARLETKLSRELKPGARIISYAFPISPWKEIKKHQRDAANHIGPIWEYRKR